nr:MAG TPA: hypothetical protein [Caudoviricetes sp.]
MQTANLYYQLPSILVITNLNLFSQFLLLF